MMHSKYTLVAVLLGCSLGVAACVGTGENGMAESEGEASAALNQIGALERFAERTAPRVPTTGSAPSFVVDPSWPKPLPNNWRISQVGGIHVDQDDNIWVYHRPRALDASSAGALRVAGTNGEGVSVNALGHPIPYGEQRSGCCVPAPSVLKFDQEGNLLDAWGGPADPGFLEEKCRTEDGCFWPAREHGIFVDHNDFVYISGNGQDFTGQFAWAATFGDDSHVLKSVGRAAIPSGEPGVCGFVGEVHIAPHTASGTSGTLALSTDAGQSCLYIGDWPTVPPTSSTGKTSTSWTGSAVRADRSVSSIGSTRWPLTHRGTVHGRGGHRASGSRSSSATGRKPVAAVPAAQRVGLYSLNR